MWEDRLKRRLQRWSQWQTRLVRAADAHVDHTTVGHWSRSVPGSTERVRLPADPHPVRFDPVQATDLSHGIEAINSLGRYWHISRPLVDVWPASRDVVSRMTHPALIAGDKEGTSEVLHQFIQAFPGRTLFLDLETCGLAGSAIFLVGLIRAGAGSELLLEQLWARNHAEEAGLIGALRQIADGCDMLITFNGKSFDWPQVRDRVTLHTRMVGAIRPLAHLDLLHLARRRYKKRFGDCRLQTLERHVCGRFRVDDLGSAKIPAVYAEYVRSGDARLVRSILHHNTLDLVTLLQLAVTLAYDDTECGTTDASG